MVNDESVSVVALYLEGVRDSKMFFEGLRNAAKQHKPVVILKSGKSALGAAAAASHTGSMAGSAKTYDAIFRKYGVIQADTFEEFVCTAQTLCVLDGNLPKGNKYGIISLSGGESTVSADVAEAFDLEIADLSDETKANVSKYIPAFATAKNPLDATTALFGDQERTMQLFKAFNDDPEVAAITVGANVKLNTTPNMYALCEAMAKAAKQGLVTKPLIAVPSLEGTRSKDVRYLLESAGVPLMSSMGTAFNTLRRLAEFSAYKFEEHTAEYAVPRCDFGKEHYALTEFDSKKEMAEYGVPVPAQKIARSEEEVRNAFKKMKAPLALKINSDEILHKTDVGGVKLSISSEDDAVLAFNDIKKNVAVNAPGAAYDGILMQEMVPAGVEIIVGVTNDRQFGPMILVGLGGVFVEVFKDAVLYPAPLNKAEALNMIKSLKAYKLLAGYRGSKPADIDALAEMLVNIGNYAVKNKDELKEMDLNPVFVYPEGEGVCAVDALIVKYK